MAEHDVLQLLSDTDRRGPQVAGVELASALEALGTSVRTVALRRGGNTTSLDVDVVASLVARRAAARRARVVLAQGSTSLLAAVTATAGTRRGFVYRSIGDLSYWASSPVRRTRVGVLLRQAAGVVALWPGAATTLEQRFGIERDRITVIPQAAPAERYPAVTPAERAAARAHLGLPASATVVLYVGQLAAEKRLDLVLAAVRSLDDAVLAVVGDGPRRAEVAAAAGDDGRARLLGARADVPDVLAAGDALVLASDTEGVPGVLVEAGLRGLPVVATAVGGVPSVVLDGVTGVLVPPGDAEALADGLARALRDRALGEAARAHCLAGFTLDVVAPRWRDALQRAMTPLPRSGH